MTDPYYPRPPYPGPPPGYPAPPGHYGPSAYPAPAGYGTGVHYPAPAGYPAAAPHYPMPPQGGGSGPYWISLVKHTGMLLLWHNRTYRVHGTLADCERAYRDAQTHNLTAGWWSLTSALLMNWISLAQNASAIRKLRRIARRQAEPARPGQA
ncbi:hypothetical protein [Mycobacterium branderi]|uniref:Uncharacterized protein n=1 Tax=Mycobacterium branderi TaxID=43348 RepID=A0A7I7WCI9_9MYCO|nr:hypothetical protein [Mycobacterium branderi]MCV7236299.1 hypothetical protein [Mycobacterium branderi]ORA35471.1 hypothetical protein BST20_17945 [Mycobacterium branderi]BBZ15184.1 hypothetical protein MBRA_53790 [Mycobacterium branderi]